MKRLLVLALALPLVACGKPAANQPTAETVTLPPSAAPVAPPTPAEPAPPAPAPVLSGVDLTQPVNALGTEPFWGLEIRSDGLTFSGVDRPEKVGAAVLPTMQGNAATWRTKTLDGMSLTATLTAQSCSDGMSDRTYPLTAHVQVGPDGFDGCAASTAFIQKGGEGN